MADNRAVLATPRTLAAIRKADRIPRNLLQPERPRSGVSPTPRRQQEAGGYDGPFAVVKETDTSVKVLGKNTSNGRNFENEIYIGIIKLIKPEFTLSVSYSGFVTLYISYSGSSYSVGHYFTATITPANGIIYVPLAWVDFANGKIVKITQIQYGMIHFPARLL